MAARIVLVVQSHLGSLNIYQFFIMRVLFNHWNDSATIFQANSKHIAKQRWIFSVGLFRSNVEKNGLDRYLDL